MGKKNQSKRLAVQQKENEGAKGIFGKEAKEHDFEVAEVSRLVEKKLKIDFPQLEFRYRNSIKKEEINSALQKIDSDLGKTLFVLDSQIRPDGGLIEVKDDNGVWRVILVSEAKQSGKDIEKVNSYEALEKIYLDGYKNRFKFEVREHEIREKDGEVNTVGNTFFVDLDGKKVDTIAPTNDIIVLNFPGSGMAVNRDYKKKLSDDKLDDRVEKCKENAKTASEKTKELISENKVNAKFYTAVYEYKADLVIDDYNTTETPDCDATKDIFNKTIAPLLSDDFEKTKANLNKLFLRGHCFGTVVISQLEHLLEEKLKTAFDDKQVEELLHLPKAFISSPALSLENYPKHFQTTAIVNISDRTIASGEGWRDELKVELEKLTGFNRDKRLSLKKTKDVIKNENYNLVPIEIEDISSKLNKDNVKLYVSNRANFPRNFEELKENIKKKTNEELKVKNKNIFSDEAFNVIIDSWKYCIDENQKMPENCEDFDKKVKKWLKGHEYFCLPKELKDKFEQNLKKDFNKVQNSNMFDDGTNKLQNLDSPKISIPNNER